MDKDDGNVIKSESGNGWIVRLFNPSNKAVKAAVRLNQGFTGPVKGSVSGRACTDRVCAT